MIIARVLSWGLILILAACTAPQSVTPGPTPEAIQIFYPPSLQPWLGKLAACSHADSQIAEYFLPANANNTPNPQDIRLELGQPTQAMPVGQLFQVGWEQVVVIVNRANPVSKLTDEQVRYIFSGEISAWENDQGQLIQVWVLPEDDPIRQIFNQGFDLPRILAPQAKLAPDLPAMLQSISSDESAIGYLPLSIINDGSLPGIGNLKIVQLENGTELKLIQPVLAFTANAPTGATRQVLDCLQSSSPN